MKINKYLLSALKFISVLAFWMIIWVFVSFRINNEFLFPSPISVINAFSALAITPDFWTTTGYSLLRIVIGILVSLFVGTAFAILTEKSRFLNALISPILGLVKAVPVASFIILALLWINRNTLPLFITSLIVIPIVWSNVSEGIRSVDKDLVDVAKIYRFSPLKRLLRLYVPSVAPFFMAACRSSLGMAWKAGISAEVLSTPQNAIGTELYFSKTYLETPSLFAWTLVIIILSFIIEKLFVYILERVCIKMHITVKGDKNDKT